MITKYWAYNESIIPRNFVRETEKMLITNLGFRTRKNTDWCAYKDTFEEAKAYLLEKAEEQLQDYIRLAQEQENKCLRIKGLQP